MGIYCVLVDAAEETARRFYLRCGFVPLEEYPLTLDLPLKTILDSLGYSSRTRAYVWQETIFAAVARIARVCRIAEWLFGLSLA